MNRASKQEQARGQLGSGQVKGTKSTGSPPGNPIALVLMILGIALLCGQTLIRQSAPEGGVEGLTSAEYQEFRELQHAVTGHGPSNTSREPLDLTAANKRIDALDQLRFDRRDKTVSTRRRLRWAGVISIVFGIGIYFATKKSTH